MYMKLILYMYDNGSTQLYIMIMDTSAESLLFSYYIMWPDRDTQASQVV
jgi:hypothetical protein